MNTQQVEARVQVRSMIYTYLEIWVIASIVGMLAWVGVRLHMYKQFESAFERHLRKAYTSDCVDTARFQLDEAITYLERNGLTHGSTAAFYPLLPKEDLKRWYKNLKDTSNLLHTNWRQLNAEEEKNLLHEARLYLSDVNERTGDKTLSVPMGISIYPHNYAFAIWVLICLPGLLLVLFLAAAIDN